MTKDEMLLSLKKDFDVDVQGLQAISVELTQVKSKLVSLQEDKDKLQKENSEVVKGYESEKIDLMLSELIEKGKSTKHLNETVHSVAFKAVGYEVSKQMFSELLKGPEVVKTAPVGTSFSDSSSDSSKNESELFDMKARKLMSEDKNLSYPDATKLVLS